MCWMTWRAQSNLHQSLPIGGVVSGRQRRRRDGARPVGLAAGAVTRSLPCSSLAVPVTDTTQRVLQKALELSGNVTLFHNSTSYLSLNPPRH